MKNQRFLYLLFVISLVASLFTACSKSTQPTQTDNGKNVATASTSPAAKKDPVTLRYMIWDQSQQPAYQKAIDQFQQQNPNIKIQLQVVPWASYWEKLLTEIAGGSAPDVFWAYAPRLQDFISKKSILDLTDRIKKDNVDLSKFNPTLVDSFASGGKNYALPKDVDIIGLFYNKDLLKKAGYDNYPSDLSWNPKDGGTFVKFLQSITVDKNGKHPNETGFDSKNIVQYGLAYIDSNIEPADVESYAASNGASVLKDNQFQLDDKLKDTMQFVHDLTYKYYVTPSFTDLKIAGPEAKFLASQVAVWQTGAFRLNSISQKAPFEFGTARVPAGPEGSVVRVNGLGDHIYAQTKYPEEAWKWVQFIDGKTTGDILGGSGTVIPAFGSSIQSFVDFYKAKGIDVSPFVEAYKGKTVLSPSADGYNEWRQVWIQHMSLSLSGELDMQEALKKIKTEGKK